MNRAIVIGCLLLTACSANAQPARGGTNYIYYQMDAGCSREPYGIIYNYDTHSSTINSELQTMYNNGQRRLRIPIFHGHNLNTGTVMDSQYGDLSSQFRTNLTNLLSEIASIGYEEVEIGFFPSGDNAVIHWTSWNEDLFQENWATIYNLHSIFANSGLLYRIDLENEGIPSSYESNYSVRLEYAQKLWNYYVYTFGKDDTVGFSTEWGNVSSIPSVYGSSLFGDHGYPYLFDVHIYEDAYDHFLSAYSALNSQGYNPGWIIGEAYYNDAAEAAALSSAMAYTGQTVFYVAQFTSSAAQTCGPGIIDVAPPFSFGNYISYSF